MIDTFQIRLDDGRPIRFAVTVNGEGARWNVVLMIISEELEAEEFYALRASLERYGLPACDRSWFDEMPIEIHEAPFDWSGTDQAMYDLMLDASAHEVMKFLKNPHLEVVMVDGHFVRGSQEQLLKLPYAAKGTTRAR